MNRNTPTNTNHGQRRTNPFDPRTLPAYQRLLTPSVGNVYPYQSPPSQNGMSQPRLFLIDKGRKTIKIAGGSPVTLYQPSPSQQSQPTYQPTLPRTSDRGVSSTKTPETPNTYKLLVQVLGDKPKIDPQGATPPTSADSRLRPQTSTQPYTKADGPGKSPESSGSTANSWMAMASKDRNKKSSVSDGMGKSHETPEHPAGNSTANMSRAHIQLMRNSSPATPSKRHSDPRDNPSRPDDTPKTSTGGRSDASGSSRKRTHDSHVAHAPSPKPDTSNPSDKALDKVSEAIWKNYMNSKQSSQRLYTKENLRQTLEDIIQSKYGGSMLFLVGSSLNGFATNGSDTDLCLMVSNKELNQKYHATSMLNVLHKLLLQRSNFVSEAQVICAKVPILKFVCSRTYSGYSGLECDININNATWMLHKDVVCGYTMVGSGFGLLWKSEGSAKNRVSGTPIYYRHTQKPHPLPFSLPDAKLMCHCTLGTLVASLVDWRVAPLVILIKQWASGQGINDASQGTLSSYSLVLMVINYLQAKCDPCVLPSLHQIHSSTFNSYSDVRFLYDTHPSNPLPSYIIFRSKNTDSLWHLFRGFFTYYVEEFRFQTNVICVRQGNTYPLANASCSTRDWINKYIYIEEPFDRTNTARAVYNEANFRRIIRTFERTHRKLSTLAKTDSVDPKDVLNLRYGWSTEETPPVKKKKR